MLRLLHHYFCIIYFSVTLIACGGGNEGPSLEGSQERYIYSAPEEDNDWETSSAEAVGLSITSLENMINRQNLQQRNIHSILLVKDAHLVFEHYFSGRNSNNVSINYDRNTRHELFSISKSITSLLTGIAIDNGLIASTDDFIVSHFPDYADTLNTNEKNDITLFHSLTMQTGIDWNEFFATNSNRSFGPFTSSNDPLLYLFGLDQRDVAGSSFEYSTGVTTMVGELVARAADTTLDNYAATHLLTPLNINDVTWSSHNNGLIYAGHGITMRPIDMAKIGQLILDLGQWGSEHIVSPEWITESTSSHVTLGNNFTATGYGYYWWIREFQVDTNITTTAIYAAGSGGQYIYILPDYDLVAVFTGGNYSNNDNVLPHSLMEEDIIPSLARP